MKKLYSISYLRFIAASLVLLSHIAHKSDQYGIPSLEWYNFRGVGVDLFFILSGFIICYTTYNKDIKPTKFIKKRIERLIPLYWLFTTFALFIYLFNPMLVNSSGGETNILYSYLLIPSSDKFLINNGWTLSYDFYFYLIFCCFLLLNINHVKRFIYVFLFLCLIVLSNLISNVFFNNVIMLEFSLGIFLFLIFINFHLNKLLSIFFIFIGMYVFIFQNYYGEIETFLGRALSKGLPVSLIFLGFLGLDKYLDPLKNKILYVFNRFGEASYSIFLSHPFILVILSKIYQKIDFLHYIPFALFLYVVCMLVGLCIYRNIEKPLNNFVKNINFLKK